MNDLHIEIDGDARSFRPESNLRGRVSWRLNEMPQSVELRLFWFTQGKGDQDVGVAHTIKYDPPRIRDKREFAMTTPLGPYSFSGKLISLTWALELVVTPTDEAERVELIVSPFEREIELYEHASAG